VDVSDNKCDNGKSGYTVTSTSSTVHYLTAGDWPPYQCDDTYAASFPGNTQCVSDYCEGAVYDVLNSERMERVDAECTLPATVCATGSTLTACKASNTSASYSCKYQCKAGFKPADANNGELVCRGRGRTDGSQPMFMKQAGQTLVCEQVDCPSFSTGKVDTGCEVTAGYAGTVTATSSSPYYTSTIAQCAAGSYSATGATSCTPCVEGSTFQDAAGQASCKVCVQESDCSSGQVFQACTKTANGGCSNTPTPSPSPIVSPSPSTATPTDPPNTGGDDPKEGLDGGAIAGIVIGAIAGLVILCVVGYFIYKAVKGGGDDAADEQEYPASEDQQPQERRAEEEEDITASPPHHDLESESESDQDADVKAADDEESNVEADEVELDSEN